MYPCRSTVLKALGEQFNNLQKKEVLTNDSTLSNIIREFRTVMPKVLLQRTDESRMHDKRVLRINFQHHPYNKNVTFPTEFKPSVTQLDTEVRDQLLSELNDRITRWERLTDTEKEKKPKSRLNNRQLKASARLLRMIASVPFLANFVTKHPDQKLKSQDVDAWVLPNGRMSEGCPLHKLHKLIPTIMATTPELRAIKDILAVRKTKESKVVIFSEFIIVISVMTEVSPPRSFDRYCLRLSMADGFFCNF